MIQTQSVEILAEAIQHNAAKVNRDYEAGSAAHDAALTQYVEPLAMLMLCALAGTGDDIKEALRVMRDRHVEPDKPSW